MTRRVLFVLLIGVFVAVAAVACSPGDGPEIPLSGANDTASDTASEAANDTAGDTASEAAGDLSVAAEVGATGTPGALAIVPDVQIVDATPMSDAELAAQPTSQVEGGAAADEAGQTEPGGLDGLPPVADWPTYADSAYGFSMMVPPDFIVRAADAARGRRIGSGDPARPPGPGRGTRFPPNLPPGGARPDRAAPGRPRALARPLVRDLP